MGLYHTNGYSLKKNKIVYGIRYAHGGVMVNISFSIIIPVYKVERYLCQCVDSVINQNCKEFEVILIDDGSPDNCPAICDYYAKKDSRVKVVHKTNGGLSDARNVGLKMAKKDYIIFLDSDDFLVDGSLQSIYDNLKGNNEPDLLLGTFNSYYSDSDIETTTYPFITRESNSDNLLLKLLKETKTIPWSVWKNVFKNSIIKQYSITFRKGLIGAEDCDFFIRYINFINNYTIMHRPIVNYRRNREDSIMNNLTYKTIYCQLDVFSYYYNKYNNQEEKPIKTFFANKFSNIISTIYHLSDRDDIKNIETFIKIHQKIINNNKGIKYKFANIIWSLLGYYRGSVILSKINRIIKKR